jgi:hypothetical protein
VSMTHRNASTCMATPSINQKRTSTGAPHIVLGYKRLAVYYAGANGWWTGCPKNQAIYAGDEWGRCRASPREAGREYRRYGSLEGDCRIKESLVPRGSFFSFVFHLQEANACVQMLLFACIPLKAVPFKINVTEMKEGFC